MPVQPLAIAGYEDRSLAALADGQVDRPGGPRRERDGDDLAAFAGDQQGPVAALDAQRFDVGASGFGHAQPVERQQRNERMLGESAEPGRDQHCAELVAIQPSGMRLIVQTRAADMRGRRVAEEFFLDGVAVEPGHGTQPPGDGCPGAAAASRSRAKHSMSARRVWNSRK